MGLTKQLLFLWGMMELFQITSASVPLFKEFPLFQESLPYVQLGEWPTPISALNGLSDNLNINLYCKREDSCGKRFSGNKVRKLEFVLADAKQKNYKTLVCYGGIASNNVTCIAAYAQYLDLQSIALLMDQPITRNLKRNLLLDIFYGSNLFSCPFDRELSSEELFSFLNEHNLDQNPYVLPMGSSSVLGIIGWVNAAFELKEQIMQGVIPEPDYLYIPLGSLGTTAGLILGLRAAGLKTTVRAIQVTNPEKYSKEKLCDLIMQTNRFLYEKDSLFPWYEWSVDDLEVNTRFFGPGYACKTPEGEYARDLFQQKENLTLDETYTAKAAAALLHDCKAGTLKSQDVVLYWHTYCSDEFTELVKQVDISNLPQEFKHSIHS